MPMPFVVQAHTDNHTITEATVTAKEAFAKAIEWHVSGRFTHIFVGDDIKTYSLEAFSLAMALRRLRTRSKPLPSWIRKAIDAAN
jgi:hypothetical protein